MVEGAAKRNRNITYIGLVPHEQIGNYYAIADLVVIPSIVPEGYGLVAEEAMSLDKTVIGFKIGVKGILKNYEKGILVEEISAETLAEKVRSVVKNVFCDGEKKREIRGFKG